MRNKCTYSYFVLSALLSLPLCLFLVGCSGGAGYSANAGSSETNGNVNMMLQDSPSDDWANVGVRILSIAFNPQGGGAAVTVYTAPNPAPFINLVQLDQLSELLDNASVPAGTYASATVTIAANPTDVLLTSASDPTAGFAAAASTAVASNAVQVQGVQGSVGSQTVTVMVPFTAALVVTANQTSSVDLDFDLSQPAFIVPHVPVGAAATVWAVSFNGFIRHRLIRDLARVLLRDLYGTVTAVSDTSITITRDFPVEPPTSPETAIATSRSLTINVDATNGTIVYNVDAKTHSAVMSFSGESSLVGQFVRVTARFQPGGSLTGVRIWDSSAFNNIWASPEGHVVRVNTNTDVVTVENELGFGVPVTVNSNTLFYFRTPANAETDSNFVGQGPSFLANHDLVRGFKVHVSVVDPLAVPLVAQTIDIERAEYSGSISAPSNTGFTYTHVFPTPADSYIFPIDYISNNTPNGSDPLTGAAIKGFKWWNFTFPTLVDSGANAIGDFIKATGGSVTFGPPVGAVPVYGTSDAIWGDPANSTGWSATNAILLPSPVPLGSVAASWAGDSTGGSFTMISPPATALTPGPDAVTINVIDAPGSATLVYQVMRLASGIVTITPIDITTTGGLNTLGSHMTPGTLVKVFGVPQLTGTSIQSYVLFYYAGAVMPAE